MRRLRTWLRVSMKTERLSSLALMSIHLNVEVNYDKVATLFFELHPRKIEEKNLIFE